MTEHVLDLEALAKLPDDQKWRTLAEIAETGVECIVFKPHGPYSDSETVFTWLLVNSATYHFLIKSEKYFFEKARRMVPPRYIEGDYKDGYRLSLPAAVE
jgi:hypothetical protein